MPIESVCISNHTTVKVCYAHAYTASGMVINFRQKCQKHLQKKATKKEHTSHAGTFEVDKKKWWICKLVLLSCNLIVKIRLSLFQHASYDSNPICSVSVII